MRVNVIRAIRSAEQSDWKEFFENLRQEQYQKVSSAESEKNLLEIQNKVNGLNQLEHLFEELRKEKST